MSPVRKQVLQQDVFDQLRRYLCRRHNTFLAQISSNNFNETGQITFNCLFQKPNIKAIGQIPNLLKKRFSTNLSAMFL